MVTDGAEAPAVEETRQRENESESAETSPTSLSQEEVFYTEETTDLEVPGANTSIPPQLTSSTPQLLSHTLTAGPESGTRTNCSLILS